MKESGFHSRLGLFTVISTGVFQIAVALIVFQSSPKAKFGFMLWGSALIVGAVLTYKHQKARNPRPFAKPEDPESP